MPAAPQGQTCAPSQGRSGCSSHTQPKSSHREQIMTSNGGFCGERIPAIHLAHADLSRGEQRPEHHRGGVGRRKYSLSFDPALELLVQSLNRIGGA